MTVAKWAAHPQHGNKAGQRNQTFLDSDYLTRAFIQPLLPHRERVPVLMFEFGHFSPEVFPHAAAFRERLSPFLERLPGGWRYAIEIRNPEYLGPEYFRLLARHNVAHVFNAWTRMPTLAEQLQMEDIHTADFSVVRALLKRGRTYAEAVKLFEPYQKVRQPDQATRRAIVDVAQRALRKKQKAIILAGNRLEGNSPGTIEAVAAEVVQVRR